MRIDDFEKFKYPKSLGDNLIIINRTEHRILAKVGQNALLMRPGLTFGLNNFDLEKKRRESAVAIGISNLKGIIPNTKYIDASAICKSDGKIYPLITRVIPWYFNVEELQTHSLKSVLTNKEQSKAIIKVAIFTLLQFIIKGRIYDFFCLFSEFSKEDQRGRIENLLIPRNIMIGEDKQRVKKIFIDSDWYMLLSDSKITGFSKFSYITRFLQGAILLCISILIFSTSIIINLSKKTT